MIILSGMHLSIATHLCAGELAAVKWSVLDEKASCGMNMVQQTNPTKKSYNAESCCKDEMSFYAVDNNYQTSTVQINKPADQILQVFYIPSTLCIQFVNAKSTTHTHVQPPGKFITSAVSLPDICVFLI